jgi:hypothetical protein
LDFKTGKVQEMTSKTRDWKVPRYAINMKHVPQIEHDLESYAKVTSRLIEELKSIRQLASYDPPKLLQLPTVKTNELLHKKLNALVLDITDILETLTLGLGVCSDYAIKSAYANHYTYDCLTHLEQEINRMGKNTGVNVSKLKTEVAQMKKAVLPAAKKWVEFTDSVKQTEEERKKNGDMMIA